MKEHENECVPDQKKKMEGSNRLTFPNSDKQHNKLSPTVWQELFKQYLFLNCVRD